MAHELEIINGVAQMAYAGDVPWHGLGKKVPSDLAPAQMLEAAGLDWTVEKRPLFFDTQAGRKMTDQFALVQIGRAHV